eukprot:TRINITY_DN658_c0_g1_i1.p2 TRINITY_DN658_c0_g1~~TRINITY_DN658_c0_g1_i1.p2  ORF type:complete len:138 (-),score=20.59 TRINITY_DN658_c0_g1_i1:69-482(-)
MKRKKGGHRERGMVQRGSACDLKKQNKKGVMDEEKRTMMDVDDDEKDCVLFGVFVGFCVGWVIFLLFLSGNQIGTDFDGGDVLGLLLLHELLEVGNLLAVVETLDVIVVKVPAECVVHVGLLHALHEVLPDDSAAIA